MIRRFSAISTLGLITMIAGCGAAAPEPSAPTASTAPPTPQAAQPVPGAAASRPRAPAEYRAIIGVDRVKALMADPKTVLVDVRSPDDYAKGHLPGAINVHGDLWRTPSAKGGKPGHDFFSKSDGSVDAAKYEALLGGAGIANDSKVIVYGNHSGKADGSVPAMVLLAVGHKEVGFFDGIGVDRWKAAGNSLATEATKRPPAVYRAQASPNFVWSAEQVHKNLKAKDIVIVDARTPAEYSGADARDNKRAGHIPGAVNVNYEDLLSKDKTTMPAPDAHKLLVSRGVTPEKKVVVYCQTATRAAHHVMVLRDLGYTNVAIYDGSWQDWGNRDDTPIEK